MTAMKRYQWDSAEYAEAFAALLHSYGPREQLYSVLRDLLVDVVAEAAAIDWGAGTGDLTRVLLERARTVYAVEPSPTMRATLAVNCPAAQVIDGTIMSASPPGQACVAVLSYVLYHIPDHLWGAHVIRAARSSSRAPILAATGCSRSSVPRPSTCSPR
jgi:trans-aconitate methyltransferase